MIAKLAKQIFEDALVNGGLDYTDEIGNPGNLKIAQICINDVDDTDVDENTGRQPFPIVIFEEGRSSPKSVLYNPSSPFESPLYDTELKITVLSKSSIKDEKPFLEQANNLCYAVQTIVMKGFYDMTPNASETLIDNVLRGWKSSPQPGVFHNDKKCLYTERSLIITNRIEP